MEARRDRQQQLPTVVRTPAQACAIAAGQLPLRNAQRAPAAFLSCVAFELMTPIRLSQELTNALAPSCCNFAARAARSTPALVNSARTDSLSPPSAGIASPTLP